MYSVKPYFNHDFSISANTSSMYGVKPYYDIVVKLPSEASENKAVCNDVSLKRSSVSPAKTSSSERRASSKAEENLLEDRQRKLVDRLNNIKKQLDQLQSKFRNNAQAKSLDSSSSQKVVSSEPKQQQQKQKKKQKEENAPPPPPHVHSNELVVLSFAKYENRIIFEDLAKFGERVNICIAADPKCPPLSIFVLSHLVNERYGRVLTNVYVHSSVCNELPKQYFHVFGQLHGQSKSRMTIYFVWQQKSVPKMTIKCTPGETPLSGEDEIARFLAKVANFYPEAADAESNLCDTWCRLSQKFVQADENAKQAALKDVDVQLGKTSFLMGESLSLADVCLWSALMKSKMDKGGKISGNVKRWLQMCNSSLLFSDGRKLCDVF